MPQIIGWQRGFNGNILSGNGMDKSNTMGQQRDAAVGIAALGTILQIALDRVSQCSELTTNLMVTSRQQLNFHQLVTL